MYNFFGKISFLMGFLQLERMILINLPVFWIYRQFPRITCTIQFLRVNLRLLHTFERFTCCILWISVRF